MISDLTVIQGTIMGSTSVMLTGIALLTKNEGDRNTLNIMAGLLIAAVPIGFAIDYVWNKVR